MVLSTMSGKRRQPFGHDVTDRTVRAYSSVRAGGIDRIAHQAIPPAIFDRQ
jgi:hypothetical protein